MRVLVSSIAFRPPYRTTFRVFSGEASVRHSSVFGQRCELFPGDGCHRLCGEPSRFSHC